MSPDITDEQYAVYRCGNPGCIWRWRWDEGYLMWENGKINVPPHSLVKPALRREHGYLYIETIESGQRMWKCAVQDCANTLAEDVS